MHTMEVWFSLPLDFSSELNSSEDSRAGREFCRLLEDSEESELSQYSYTTPQQTQTTVNQLSQYSYNSFTKLHASAGELSQYSISAMDTNSTNETYSGNESQDISTSQQSSEANLSQSGLDDGPSISSAHESQHEEVVNSAIMEVSGELMLGKLSQQKYPSGGSESSDISDDDSRRVATGGAIVKYPESSTGMSDNDWNPYATESDTNHTPRSAPNEEFRHAGGEPLTTVSMVTGEVTRGSEVQPKLQTASGNVSDDYRVIDRPESESYKPRYRDETPETLKDDADSRSGRLDILRYMIDDSKAGVAQALERQTDDKNKFELEVGASPTDKDDEGRKSVESNKSDISEPSQRSQGGFSRDSEETLKGRESVGSALSLPLDFGMDTQPDRLSEEKSRRESAESAKSLPSDRTDSQSGRQSAESGRSDEYKRESIESYKSLPAEEYGGRSGRQSTEASRSPRSGRQSLESWKSPRSELDQSEEARTSGRESAESQHSLRSDRSRGSEHSQRSQRSQGSVGSGIGRDRLDKLNAVGDNIKELIEVESAQRPSVLDALLNQERVINRDKDPGAGDTSRRVKLSEKFEAFKAPARSLKSPPTSASASYISIAERERLLSESPDFTGMSSQTVSKDTHLYKPDSNFKDAYPQDLRSSASAGARSPTGVAINRVSDLFEETKKQSRAAVSLPRPDPSGSEERFPLRERLSVSQHDDSFKSHDRSQDRTRHSGIGEKSRDSETARSITSEEVARVLGRYADTEAELKRTRMEIEKENRKPGVQISAFDKMDRSGNALRSGGIYGNFEAAHPDMSDDEIAKRVRAILSDTEYLGIVGGNGKTLGRDISDPTEKYVPHTIDYSKLQRDLQEIQDSLHDVPPPKANDSMYQFRPSGETEGEQHNLSGTSDSVPFKSAETTSTSGRESGISNFGRKLAWDHAADLNYNDGATGHFYGTMSTDNTLGGTQKLRKSGASDSDNLIVRAESTTTNDSETDDQIRQENTMAAAQSVVDQVLSRHAEGPLQETVEDIIARYRNERKDLKDKFQPGKDLVSDKETMPIERPVKELQSNLPIRAPTTEIPPSTVDVNTNAKRPPQMGNKQAGLAERVYKILSSDQGPEPYQAPPPQLEQGMAKKVYQILSSDRPGNQVNGILTDTMEKEHEMLKSLVQQQQAEKDDSSFEVPPRLNGTSDSFALSERDVRRQLEWSLLSSPGKGDKTGLSDFSTIRKVTSAPYSSVDTAKTLLSAQMQKMTERNFDKSVELRTPFRQAIDCYPVYGIERDRKQEPEQRTREAWMPVPNPSSQSPAKAAEKRDPLASERFYLTHKDSSPPRQATRGHYESPQRHRTYSDPFEVSPSRNPADRVHHPRSKSEGPADVSDLTQLSYDSTRHDPTNRRAASSSHRLSSGTDTSTEQPAGPVGLVTPARHNPQVNWSYEPYSCTDSSELYYHSDSSEGHGNKWRNHGYQLYKPSESPKKMPPNIEDSKKLKKNYSFSTYRDFKKNYLSQKAAAERPSRSRFRESRSAGLKPKNMKTKDSHYHDSPKKDLSEPERKKLMLSKDAVYDLLSQSRAQEMKVAEFQNLEGNFIDQDEKMDLAERVDYPGRKIGKVNFADSYGNTNMNSGHGAVKAIPRKVYRYSGHESISPTESDSSGSKKLSKLRPYRPAGSRDVYYTESADDTNESGTTIESTHPGSDDAVPPYIPKQYLGTRTEEPARHPTGIYSTSSKEALSTIDEKTQDGKERLSGSDSGAVGREPEAQLRARAMYTDSDRSGEPGSKCKDTDSRSLATDAGYHTGTTAKSSYEAERSREAEQRREAAVLERQRDEARLRELELKRKLDDLKENYLNKADVRPSATGRESREDRILKTREEYLRDLEAREGENMLRHQFSEEKMDPFGASVRSDPGGMLDDRRDMADLAEFRLLEPDPLYPQERVRHSRSRSETDLNTLSPAESQRYSSPMQPGTRFMELSSQPSPISHHESMRAGEPDTQPGYQPATRTMTTSREPERQISSHSTARTGVPSSEVRDPVRETAKVRSESPRTDTELRYPAGARLENDRAAYTRVETRHFDNMYPQELPRVDDRHYPMELPVVPEPRDTIRADEREVESAKRRGSGDRQRSISPLHVREKELERELEEMKRELAAQVQEVQGNNAIADTEEFEDNFPPSKKAQVLREVLEQEYIDNIPPNINDMWNRFKELNDNTRSESSLNSTRLDALSGLLQNPTQHTVQSFVSEKEEERRKKKQEMEEAERVKAERTTEKEREKRLALEKAAYERIVKKREMRQQQQRLSEEESNGSYAEILMEREKKERVKAIQKNKEGQKSREKKSTKTPESEKAHKKSRKNKENQSHKSPEEKAKHSKESRREEMRRMAKIQAQHSDTMDTLFSIPEDASFEMSPTKLESELKARQKRHRHVIDPLMKKLRDKIKLQRDKIDKERRKELQRVEKLKKLEMLLTAKRKGKLSDKAIDVELGNVSSTTANSQSESSLMSSDATLTAGSTTMESDGSTQGSTTLKESSIDSHISPKLQYKKYEDPEGFATPMKHYPETDSSATHSETSDFSNIVVERIPEKKSSGKKSRSKEKKSRMEGSGHKVRKEKDNKKKKVFGVELSDELLTKQLQRYEKYISPGKHRKQMDAATMYPSPITVSPVTRRRLRDVYMKSEAIQTSPSIRSTSPCHSYDETPVAPVPLMAGTKQHSHRRQSPDQSSMSQSRMSRSPVDKSRSRSSGSRKSLRKSSRSPSAETQTDISASLSKPKTVSQTRRKKPQSPMWKPETPPKNSMFEPEMADENREPFKKDQDIPQGTSWFIPLKPSQPWRKPLKERQAFSMSREPWETKSVSQSTWKKIVHGDILKDRSDVTNVSRDTKFDLDTTGQRIGDEESGSGSEESDEDVLPSKPLSKMTLQEAFQQRKQVVLSRLRERQKRLHLAAEERKMQAYLQLERDRLFQEERKKEANPEAHPYSDNLFRPTRRVISKEEMKEMAKKKYKKLPEVVEQAKLQKRAEQYSLNRLKARLFNRKVQRHVLVKAEKWGR